jgi:hypothetical protein
MGKIRIASLFLSVMVMCGGSLSAAQGEQWLQYCAGGRTVNRSLVRPKRLELSSERPEGVDLPDFAGQTQFFAKWTTPMVEAGYLWIVVDKPLKVESDWRLFIDSDGDGHLNDETAYRDDGTGMFYSVRILFEGEDGPIAYHLDFRLSRRNEKERLHVYSAGSYESTITVGNEKIHCVLIDYNVNGAFNDKAVNLNFRECDLLLIGPEGEENAELVSKYVKIGDKIYSLEIPNDGASIKLEEATDLTLGKVRLDQDVVEFTVGGESGSFTIRPENEIVEIPTGRYQINHCIIERQDKEGALWKLVASGFDEESIFDVNETVPTELVIAEPIVIEATVDEKDSVLTFSRPRIKGRFGERIIITRNGSRPWLPELVIKNKDGSYDKNWPFQYG